MVLSLFISNFDEGMKRKILFVIIIILIVAVADFTIGLVSGSLIKNAPDVGINQTNTAQALFKRKADVLVLGSSRANHSFDCGILQHRLGKSVYNAGRDGQNIVYDVIVLNAYLERYKPQMVVLDMNNSMMSDDWNVALSEMNCYYGLSKSVDSIIQARSSWVEKLKLQSNIYRYNNTWQWLLKAYTGKEVDLDGYRPMPVNEAGNMKADYQEDDNFKLDSANLAMLDALVNTCMEKNIKLVLTYSPTLSVTHHGFIDWLSEYSLKHHLPFYNTMMDPDFLNHPELFYDYTHLNDNGAKLFSEKFCEWLKRRQANLL